MIFIISFIFLCVGLSHSGKKRNISHREINESPAKKPKVDSSKPPVQEVGLVKDDKKRSPVRGHGRKAGHSKNSSNKGKDGENLTAQTGSIPNALAEENQVKKKSPLKHIPEATPENLQGSPRKDKVVQKKLILDLESAGKQHQDKNDAGGSSSEETSDDEAVAWEDVDGLYIIYFIYLFIYSPLPHKQTNRNYKKGTKERKKKLLKD